MTGPTWSHATSATHPVEPHHDSTGRWLCYACREPVVLDGAKVAMTAVPALDVFAAPRTVDPDRPGLAAEGS